MSLEQDDMRRRLETLEKGAWTVVFETWWETSTRHGTIYCGLGPVSARSQSLREPSWDVTPATFGPGFSQHHSEKGEWVTTYSRGIGEEGFEPIVIERRYHGVVPNTLEVVEEFRHYHNLYWDELTSQFIKPNDDGTSTVAIKMSDERVEISTKLLRQYQAARQLDLHICVDSVRFSEGGNSPENVEWQTDRICAHRYSGDMMTGKGQQTFTRYLGKRILPPPPVEKAGIWPYEEEDDYFPDFVIGINDDGDEVRSTCNPDAPHYLTPVHFRREVLQKYYEKPELYEVSDGRLTCASLWGIQIDNSTDESVVVFLGDLGRDLPKQERDYWRSFNVAPASKMSETLVRRAFLGQWAEPTAGDLQVRSKYASLSKSWAERHGWDLFRKPEEADAGLLQRLRLPLNESQAEFEASIRTMTLLFVDSINEAEIQKLLPEKIDNEKGIAKLKRWFEQEGYSHVERDVKFLRNLQDLRSTGVAHRKGSRYEKTLNQVFGKLRGAPAVRTLFESALAMLTGLDEWVASSDEGV